MLYPHQSDGALWLAQRERACLADDPGLGKTITAIKGASMCGARKMLVLAPTCVAWNWHHECGIWAPKRDPVVITAGRYANIVGRTDTTIMTHGMLLNKKVHAAVCDQAWDVCVVDESHFFRGRNAKRSNLLYHLGGLDRSVADVADRTWCLSGTPMPNNPSDLWTMCHGLWPDEFSESFAAFRARYCITTWTPFGDHVKVIGGKNLDELRERLRGRMLRRRADDVLDLPPVRYETVALRPDKMPQEIELLAAELPASTLAILNNPENCESPEEAFDLLGESKAFAAFRRWCGLAKAEATADLLEHELNDGQLDKVVVMAHHGDVVAHIATRLAKWGVRTITGATSAADREANVRAFQAPGSGVRVIVCNILAGGTGTTLTAASELVFAEMSFVPGENTQAAIRIRRIGQERHCRVRFVSLAGTLDVPLVRVLQRKTEMIREVIDR